MQVEKAIALYFGKTGQKYNCAESVVAAFDEDPTAFSACGRGNAPEGWCGAAYAAASLSSSHEEVEKAFRESAGCVTCHGIRHMRKMPCPACVEMGARLVQTLK